MKWHKLNSSSLDKMSIFGTPPTVGGKATNIMVTSEFYNLRSAQPQASRHH